MANEESGAPLFPAVGGARPSSLLPTVSANGTKICSLRASISEKMYTERRGRCGTRVCMKKEEATIGTVDCRKLCQLSYGWVPMSVSKGEIRSEEDPVGPGSRRRVDARSNSANTSY